MRELEVKSSRRNEMIDVTSKIKSALDEENLENGLLIAYVPHTTAAITINEGADPDVQKDMIKKLESLIPERENYAHSEGNSDAHIKASFLGSSVNVIVKDGKMVLGTWQHIFFYEGDGPRSRKVYVEFIKK